MKVLEEKGVADYIKKRGLEKAYLKAKTYLENDLYEWVDLRKRKPKSLNIFYFKVDEKYRVIGYMEEETFVVIEISDHQ